ncbi:MAG: hypothetical protein U0835_17160 [Isosphaeraceae bacterium]
MPIINGPYRDPEGDEPPRRHRAPGALVRLRRQFTYEKQQEKFRQVFGRDPHSDDELEAFAEEYINELYNSGYDEP